MFNRGFTLLELAVALGITSLIVTGTVFLASMEVDSSRRSETMTKLATFKVFYLN